ncbi:Ceramide glucosyltransferase [Sporothrix epigloea]|uniref:Ceramide glucosyltransferase n=1 Tax=Sporothrix epigloea TaxID=1892477 RepID=A0ABP0D783_9PEZI
MCERLKLGLACVWGVWSCVVFLVQGIGIFQLFRHYSKPPRRAAVEAFADHAAVPPVTVIRPCKGLEPGLYDCLASTCRQTYPRDRLSVRLCVESRADPAFPVLQRIVTDFAAQLSVRIYVEQEDPLLHGATGHVRNLGPNPKIRNMSHAYRDVPDTKDAVIWIVDCNVWVAPGVAGRMVDKLFGFRAAGGTAGDTARDVPYKFVHQLPLVVDLGTSAHASGAALDEMFMATTHAKFYSAINTVGIAPCIVGKSNMFRKAHLDAFTDPAQNPLVLTAKDAQRGRGVDFFSSYICEDHLIGDLLWRSPLAGYRHHGLVAGDLAIQPMAPDVTVRAYAARRVRWLRVRKWTVLLATLVEPGVESLLCAAFGAFSLTTLADHLPLPAWSRTWLIQDTWISMLRCWLVLVGLWMAADWCTYRRLQACPSIQVDDDPASSTTTTPIFVRGRGTKTGLPPRRFFFSWLRAWVGREVLALPIWTYAVLLGATVTWRGKQFHVRMDMSVVELDGEDPQGRAPTSIDGADTLTAEPANRRSGSRGNRKARVE